MIRRLAVLALFALAACSTSKPQTVEVNPATEPTVVGAIDEAARQGTIEGEAAAATGRRIGRVAGVLAAVLGGPEHQDVDDVIDRYRRTRDAVETTTVLAAAAHGANEGAKRGFQFDLQFAELLKIEGLQATRPAPDQIEVFFTTPPTHETLTAVAAVFAGREERALFIEAPRGTAMDIREELIALGLAAANIEAHRNDRMQEARLRIRYRD